MNAFLPQALILLRIFEMNQLAVGASQWGDASSPPAVSAALCPAQLILCCVQTNIVEGPEGLFWLLKDPLVCEGMGETGYEKYTNPGEHPDCSRRQLLKYQNTNSAVFWSKR